MATKIGDLFFEVSANTLKLDKTIAGIGSSAKGAGDIISNALSGSFVAAGVAATTTLAGIVSGIAAVGAASNVASQRATGLFTALTGSAEEAISLMRQFAQLSLDTPIFSGKALQDVARTLLAYGVAKDDVVDLSVAIQSAATALGVGELGAQKLALALGQVKARGFFSAEEARQLANYGINAYGLIAEAVGKTTSEVRQLGAEHRLLSEDVLPILTAKLQTTFGPVAQNLVNTFGVQVQGLKNTFIGFSSALVEPFIGRTGGGAAVEFLQNLREELDGVVTVGADGTYKLGGALAGLVPITRALADAFTEVGDSFINWIGGINENGGLDNFGQSVAKLIPQILDVVQSLAGGTVDFIKDLADAIQPIVPDIETLVGAIYVLVRDALPNAAAGFVDLVSAAAIAGHELAETFLPILVGLVPFIIDLGSAFADIASILEDLAPYIKDAIALWIAWKAAIIIAELATATFIEITLSPLVVMLGNIAVAAGLALAALGAFKAAKAGAQGDTGFLTADVPFYEKPFQAIGKVSYAYGQGLMGRDTDAAMRQLEVTQQMNDALADGVKVGTAFADAQKHSGLSMADFAVQARDLIPTVEGVDYALIEYKKILDDLQAKNVAEGYAIDANQAFEMWEDRVNKLTPATLGLNDAVDEEIDVLKELKTAAKDASDALADFLKPTAAATVDDFLLGLVKSTKDITAALAEQEKHPGILADLGVTGAENAVREQAQKVIGTLVKTYGLGLDQIKSLLGSEGLLDTIVALGSVTEETTKKVDPLIAKYGQLGATADELKDAISKLNEQRQTAIKAQIDQVEAALRDAKTAAEEARQAITDFFNGGKGSNTQKLIDTLIGNVGDIGSKIEAGLLDGGEEGAAAIRLALGDVRSALGDIVSSGLEDGLTGQQIITMLGPIGSVLQEQAQDALNRISSLDWTEGFTPAAGAEISRLLGGLLDPQAIQKLLNDAMGADASVSGLEKQLESLHAAADLDVVFTPAQVQGALDQISEETTVTVSTIVTTPEAAAAVLHAIQDILLDPTSELKMLIDRDLISKQVLDAAEEGAKQTHLVFDSTLAFNEAGLSESARDAASTFITEFNAAQSEILDQYAQSQGFKDYPSMQAALGAGVAGAMAPQVPYIPTVNVNLNQDLTMDGMTTPPINSTSQVKANSTGAGGNGTVSRTLQEIYGTTVIAGLKGPQ